MFRVKIHDGTQIIVDSGDVYDHTILGGRIGVITFNQTAPIWSDIIARCVPPENKALYLNGVDGYVPLRTVQDLHIERRYAQLMLFALCSV